MVWASARQSGNCKHGDDATDSHLRQLPGWGIAFRLQRFIAPLTGEVVDHIPLHALSESGTAAHAQARAALAAADVLLAQVITSQSVGAIAKIETNAQRVLFPGLAAPFLWPYGGQPHPRNEARWPRQFGAYPGYLGDRFLIRLIGQGVDPRVAIERYLELDVAKDVGLDRLLEMSIDQKRKRDEITGCSFAPIIERDFRDIDLFVTRDHPSLALAKPWVVEVLRRIVSDQNLLVKVEHGLKDSPFPLDGTPIHPSVIRASCQRTRAFDTFLRAASPSPSGRSAICALNGTRRSPKALHSPARVSVSPLRTD